MNIKKIDTLDDRHKEEIRELKQELNESEFI